MRKSKRDKSEQRHYNMLRIRSKNTKIEVRLRKTLWHLGIRYRINYAALPGKPDIAITKHNIAIFCDGEFWHGKDWENKRETIHSNREYWIPKIERNMKRDTETDRELTAMDTERLLAISEQGKHFASSTWKTTIHQKKRSKLLPEAFCQVSKNTIRTKKTGANLKSGKSNRTKANS